MNLLRQRPDIRRAERELAAADGAHRRGGRRPLSALRAARDLRVRLDQGRQPVRGAEPRLHRRPGDGLERVRRRPPARASSTRRRRSTAQALARYEQQLLIALQEVENALAAYDRTREERGAVADAVAASNQSLDLATLLYTDGVVDFQNVLDAQRTLLDFEERLAGTDGNIVRSVVQLYLALGGGWDPDTPPAAETTTASVREVLEP